jgi:protein EFR3
MDCNCNCFGIAASSKRPIKRYNLLVPDIFPRTEPPFNEKIDSSIERKIKKLADYVAKNPHRGPKVC